MSQASRQMLIESWTILIINYINIIIVKFNMKLRLFHKKALVFFNLNLEASRGSFLLSDSRIDKVRFSAPKQATVSLMACTIWSASYRLYFVESYT